MMDPRPRRPPASSDSPDPAAGGATRWQRTLGVWLTRVLLLGVAVTVVTGVVKFILFYDPPEAFPPGVAERLAREQAVEAQISTQHHFAAASAALAENKLAVAKAELDQATPGSQQTFDQLTQLQRDLRSAANSRVVEADLLLDSGQREQAFAIFADVVAAFPDNRDAKAGFEQSQPLPLTESGDPEWDQAVRNFARGELSDAVTLAQSCAPKVPRCESGLKDLKEFSRLFQLLEDLDVQQLSRLIKLDRQITKAPIPSRLAQQAGLRLSTIHYEHASAARAAGQWTRAVEYARLALEADPRHRGASTLLEELKGKEKETSLQETRAP